MTALHTPRPGQFGRPAVALVVALLCLSRTTTPALAQSLSPQDPPASLQQEAELGRVVVTITVLEGTVRIAGVDVELRALDGNTVLAKTMTDGAGQVTFPDVPAGRYIVRAIASRVRGNRLGAFRYVPARWRRCCSTSI